MEIKRITSLFEKLYTGDPWIDVNITSSLANISAQQASGRLLKNSNSIWEIVNHMINWRRNVLKRLQGKPIKTPGNNYFAPVTDITEAAWRKTLKKFEVTQEQWLSHLSNLKAGDLSKVYPVNEMTFYEHIHGIIQHDAYHLGQIRLLMTQIKQAV